MGGSHFKLGSSRDIVLCVPKENCQTRLFTGESFAAKSFAAIYSGTPTNELAKNYTMIVQGYFDDSGSHEGEPLYVLAGFMATAEDWIEFTDEWQATLVRHGISAFHTAEAYRLQGQFSSGWNIPLVDKLSFELAELIAKFVRLRVSVSLERRFFNEFLKGLDDVDVLSDPYFLCFYRIVEMGARFITPDIKQVDFIFDEQSLVGTRALEYWGVFKSYCPYVDARYNRPIFRSDNRTVPLQAADFFSWHLRNRVLKYGARLAKKDTNHIEIVLGGIEAHLEVIQPLEIEDIANRIRVARKIARKSSPKQWHKPVPHSKTQIIEAIRHKPPPPDLDARQARFNARYYKPLN